MTSNASESVVDSGHGLLEFARVAGRTAVTRVRSASPLKLLTPQHRGRGAWAFASTYGGGLVSGDAIHLDVRAGAGAICLLGTQASTKVYRAAITGLVCRQSLNVRVDSEAVFVAVPDPVVCFAGASYIQRQRFDMDRGAAIVVLDWLTSGRGAAGERWAFSRYESRTDVYLAGRLVLKDSLLLDQADGPIDSIYRAGRFDCFASVVLIGERVRAAARMIVDAIAAKPIGGPAAADKTGGAVFFSASPLTCGCGIVIRTAGPGPELVGRWLRERLEIVTELFGEDPWGRKA